MNFRREKIDRAIIITQYDLRGFGHPIGFRVGKAQNAKCSSAIPFNFIAFAAGFGEKDVEQSTISAAYVSPRNGSFEQCLTMCQLLAADCDDSAKEAIKFLIKEIVQQDEEMKAKVAAGNKEIDSAGYLRPLEKDNSWGKIVLALAEAFEVQIHEQVAA